MIAAILSAAAPIQAFIDSDWFGRIIVVIQLGMSVWSWAAMMGRIWTLRDLRARSFFFANQFVQQDDPLALYYKRFPFEESPLEKTYLATCKRLGKLIPAPQLEVLQINPQAPIAVTLDRARMELVESTCAHQIDQETIALNKGTLTLALITSLAPLLGLLGTVWGVMLAFFAMAESGSANIAELAPGISSALLTTVVGLIVAIPSTIFYNVLQALIESQTVDLEGFGEELMGKLSLKYRAKD